VSDHRNYHYNLYSWEGDTGVYAVDVNIQPCFILRGYTVCNRIHRTEVRHCIYYPEDDISLWMTPRALLKEHVMNNFIRDLTNPNRALSHQIWRGRLGAPPN
jgi:hypothetical protein